jgi:hypothetical protein
MHTQDLLDDVIVFELPTLHHARELAALIELRWPCRAFEDDDVPFLGVFVPPAVSGDLAAALREVESWVGANLAGEVPFWLDGICYHLSRRTVLHAPPGETSSV